MSNFEFNGITKDYIRIAKGWEMPSLAPIAHNIIKVTDRPGGYLGRSSTDVRRFQVPFILLANDFDTREAFEEDMARWLVTDVDAPLIFSKYPNRTYFARFEGSIVLDNFHPMAQGTIEFVCSDPYKYQPEETVNFVDGAATLHVPGTVDTPAIIELDVLENITYAEITDADTYFMLGIPDAIDEPVYERQTLVASYPLTTLTGWSNATTVDNGSVAGTMTATAAGFSATAFGATVDPTKWQGPAVRRSLPEALQNFRVDVDVEFLNTSRETGMIEIYLKDAGGNTVAKIGLEDIWRSLAKVQGKFQIGNVDDRPVDYRRVADYQSAWNNFKGTIRINRDGNRFRPYFAIVQPNGRHVWVSQDYVYTDLAGDHLAPITDVTIAIRKFPNSVEAVMRVRNMRVYRYNNPSTGIPTIATAGDVIQIDTRTSNVTINGEDAKFLKDFGASFLKLKPGLNNLFLEPSTALSGKVRYRGRYL